MYPKSAQRFYDQLSSEYHLIFADWRKSVRWHGDVLDKIIREKAGITHRTVLDCSCGIGTQAIGLALRGYKVHGTDNSPEAIERARKEASSFGVTASFGVADLRALDREVNGSFDIGISCDNSLPHLLTVDDLFMAAK
ncbi:class I SAM-dependent methyltransferase, partial [Chloroflexota bacterium]